MKVFIEVHVDLILARIVYVKIILNVTSVPLIIRSLLSCLSQKAPMESIGELNSVVGIGNLF